MKRVVAAVIKAEWFDFLLVEVGSIACEDTPPSQIKTYPKFHIVKGTNEIPNLQPIFFNNFSARADAFKDFVREIIPLRTITGTHGRYVMKPSEFH